MTEARNQGVGMTSMRTRERLIHRLRNEGIRNSRVLDRMREIPRHLFVEEALATRAYEDTALPIGNGQTISQPYIVARMTELLIETGELDTVLEVGTGSGYQTVVLAPFVQRLYTVERVGELIDHARARFRDLGLRNIRTLHRDGSMGLPEYGPYDGIIVTAAPEGVPHALVEQLKPGGCMVLPVGSRNTQALVRVTRRHQGYDSEIIEPVIFVPMVEGTQ